ncbi:MAG TPA: hypothetical protein VIM85_00605 [Pseudomonadales bacterium]
MKILIPVLLLIAPGTLLANPGHGLDNNAFHDLGHFFLAATFVLCCYIVYRIAKAIFYKA